MSSERLFVTTGRHAAVWSPPLVRLRFVTAMMLAGFAALGTRVIQLSALSNEKLDATLAGQMQTTVELRGRRGAILDRHHADLAVSVPVASIFADPALVKNIDLEAPLVADVLGVSVDDVRKAMQTPGRFAWIQRGAPRSIVEDIEALGLQSIGVLAESERRYPNGQLAAQVIGFVGRDGDGLEGLEHSGEGWLRGSKSRVRAVRDGRRRTLASPGLLARQDTDGGDLILTIDRRIQHVAEEALAEALATHRAPSGNAVVLDLVDGGILAMATAPGFDPNHFGRYKSSSYRNRVIADMVEPGSTVKPLIVARALNDGIVRPTETVYTEEGRYRIGKHVIHDHHKAKGLTPSEIIALSSNIGVAKLAEELGAAAVLDLYRAVGFGEETNLGLPGETSGKLPGDPRRWRRIELVNRAFGQGFAVSTIQLAHAMAFLAGDGKAATPHIVMGRRDARGQTNYTEPTWNDIELSSEASTVVREALVSAAGPEGTGSLAQVPGYVIAGKTGTAQKYDTALGAYSEEDWYASFVGFLPADNPRVVIAVGIDEPKEDHLGGIVAAPVFQRIAIATMQVLDIDPTQLAQVNDFHVKESAMIAKAVAGPEAAAEAVAVGVEGVPDPPLHPADFISNQQGIVVPDLRGWSLRDALAAATRAGLQVHVAGSGNLTGQHPPPGSYVQYGDILELALGGSRRSGS